MIDAWLERLRMMARCAVVELSPPEVGELVKAIQKHRQDLNAGAFRALNAAIDLALARQGVIALEAEAAAAGRMRNLLADYDARRHGRCAWCGSSLEHEESCPAFHPEGGVKP